MTDFYFSADVETDGPIPGPFSMLSFSLVFAGSYDGETFRKPHSFQNVFYAEIKPISENFQAEAMAVNKLDRERLLASGQSPETAMNNAYAWIASHCDVKNAVLVAYPVSFDWSWLFWYFTQFSEKGSPFGYSRCFDIKTAIATHFKLPITQSGRNSIPSSVSSRHQHTHHAVDDAIEQAEIFSNVLSERLPNERTPYSPKVQ